MIAICTDLPASICDCDSRGVMDKIWTRTLENSTLRIVVFMIWGCLVSMKCLRITFRKADTIPAQYKSDSFWGELFSSATLVPVDETPTGGPIWEAAGA